MSDHNVGLGLVEDSPEEREIQHLRKVLNRINEAACYASEEDTSKRYEALLLIGQLARGEVTP